jgi:hypothetical protein
MLCIPHPVQRAAHHSLVLSPASITLLQNTSPKAASKLAEKRLLLIWSRWSPYAHYLYYLLHNLDILFQDALKKWVGYGSAVEKGRPPLSRLIFYRGGNSHLVSIIDFSPLALDGVSEGRFAHVLGQGMSPPHSSVFLQKYILPFLRRVANDTEYVFHALIYHIHADNASISEACVAMKMRPKITLIIVGKRHHIR